MCWKDWKSLRRPHFPLHLRRATRAGTSSTIMMHLHHVDDVARIGYRHLILQLQYYKAWQLMTVRLQRQSRPKQDLATAHALQDRWPAGYCSGYLFRRPPGSAGGVPWHDMPWHQWPGAQLWLRPPRIAVKIAIFKAQTDAINGPIRRIILPYPASIWVQYCSLTSFALANLQESNSRKLNGFDSRDLQDECETI